MHEFVITVTAFAHPTSPDADPEAYGDAFVDASAKWAGVVQAAARGWELTFGVEDSNLRSAVDHAWNMVDTIVESAGLDMPRWEINDIRATHAEIIDAEILHPNAPDLVSGPEAAEILRVSKARVHQLAKEHRDFPKPLYVLAAGSLWTRSAVEAFEARWDRTPGRPRKLTPPPEMPVQTGADEQNATYRAELTQKQTAPQGEKAR